MSHQTLFLYAVHRQCCLLWKLRMLSIQVNSKSTQTAHRVI